VGETTTVVVAVVEPPALLAVSVKVVVAVTLAPVELPATVPMPGEIDKLVALATLQLSMTLPGVLSDAGVAAKLEIVGTAIPGVVGVEAGGDEPPEPAFDPPPDCTEESPPPEQAPSINETPMMPAYQPCLPIAIDHALRS
jgi:hypothetical protein